MGTNKRLRTLKMGFSENIYTSYYWFCENFKKVIDVANSEFFKSQIELRFMGISEENNILFYGDEYFVNKVQINRNLNSLVRISKEAVGILLTEALGERNKAFALEDLSELEGRIITSYCDYLYKKISPALIFVDKEQKTFISSKDCNLTFFIKISGKHAGKLIITIPEYILPKIPELELKDNFSFKDFEKTPVRLNIAVGRSKISLEDLKNIENGDILVLEKSNINRMAVIYKNGILPFKVNPDPALIINFDNNGGKIMDEQNTTKNGNMWDSITVDIVAELGDVKLPLGELKQISEGLVIDLGSVYENKVNLRVENQIVASGELVIINDRYGIKISDVRQNKSDALKVPAANQENAGETQPAETAPENADKTSNEEFDYSYFDIEDESI